MMVRNLGERVGFYSYKLQGGREMMVRNLGERVGF